jgi:methylglutaconyl-CoA hydratase
MNRRDGIELLLLGERVPAARVAQAGLINKAVPADELDAAVAGYVEALSKGGPQALAATKDLLRQVPGMPRAEAFAWTAEMSARLFNSDEARAGMMAFLSKQPAPWVADT